MPGDIAATVASFQACLAGSRKVLALVGAGLSAGLGLATFRGTGGMWRNLPMIDLATPEAFHRDPGVVWQFYSHRRYMALQAEPNAGHRALAQLAQRWAAAPVPNRFAGTDSSAGGSELAPDKQFLTLTQNVDGLHQRAQHPADRLVELHGLLFTLRCTLFMCTHTEENNYKHPLVPALQGTEREFSRKRREGDDAPAETPTRSIPEQDLPHCPECGEGLLRPGVVWFGETLPFRAIDKADRFVHEGGGVDLVLVVGTSGTVWPAAGYVETVRALGGKVAVFNPEQPEGDYADWWFPGSALETLPAALARELGV